MTREHLSDWEIEEAVIHPDQSDGDRVQQHLKECGRCRSNKERLHEILHLYRDAALLHSEALARGELPEGAAAARPMVPSSTILNAAHSYGWGLFRLAMALFLLLAVLIPFFIRSRREHHAAQLAKDNLLL